MESITPPVSTVGFTVASLFTRGLITTSVSSVLFSLSVMSSTTSLAPEISISFITLGS